MARNYRSLESYVNTTVSMVFVLLVSGFFLSDCKCDQFCIEFLFRLKNNIYSYGSIPCRPFTGTGNSKVSGKRKCLNGEQSAY